MQPRQYIVDIFSTFVQFDAHRFSDWVTDRKLRRSMQNCLDQISQEKSENFWVLYWHKVWLGNHYPLASAHLTAYLQEVCYRVARKIAMNFAREWSVADFFQTAIAHVHKIFKGFHPEYGSNLKSYAELAFTNILKDNLRQRQEADICTDWALLHKLSRKRLVKSLQYRGFHSQTIETYILAWECFKELYAADNTKIRKLVKPEAQIWLAITNLYNVQRLSLSSSPTPAGSPETLVNWLENCAKAVRNYLYPTLVSIDAPLFEQETGNLLNILPASLQESLLTEIIAQEEATNIEEQTTELTQVLTNALAALDAQSQKLLLDYYSQELTQQQIAEQLQVKQYQISRRISSIKKSLLLTLTQWSYQTLHTSPTADVLEGMSTALEEWLKVHYCHAKLE
ncbi:MAG: sigma-70 family RNA polymerase sigma factor [Stigonema ocellatum SAG 48.90 = DSM 106950]|nr:sigma-70 family RNA polymerase sigma factor [Stigonema ocellatum SAG 48.90 = DSM 106950]